jgi:hypothetical protein
VEDDTLITRPGGQRSGQLAGEQIGCQEVDLEREFIAVGGEGVPFGRGDGGVVDQDVEHRVGGGHRAGQCAHLAEEREVRHREPQQRPIGACRHQAFDRVVRGFGVRAVDDDRVTPLDEQADGLPADAGRRPGHQGGPRRECGEEEEAEDMVHSGNRHRPAHPPQA